MPQVLVARVICPNCRQQYQTPIEQILDVSADPGAKVRLVNGLVNIAVCPHCRAGGGLNLPLFYHDPDKELALAYMPMEAGQDNLQRQQAIGQLTRAVIESLPAEERKAYLLQPQVFLSLESMVNRVLEADGVTQEMVEEQRAKAGLLKRLVEVESPEALEAMVKENDSAIDVAFFQILAMNIGLAQGTGRAAVLQRLLALREKLLELSSEGRVIKAREDLLEALRADPTRGRLLELLSQAADETSREMLVAFGRPLLDYAFFQALTARIDSEADAAEKERLVALRQEVLAVRDRLDEEARAVYEERAALLRDLMVSSDPESLARRRFAELDQAFFNVLTGELQEARAAGEEEAARALEAIWSLVLQLMEETLPPEVRLVNQLMGAEDEAEIDASLRENRPLVTHRLAQLLEKMAADLEEREDTQPEIIERLKQILEKVRAILA